MACGIVPSGYRRVRAAERRRTIGSGRKARAACAGRPGCRVVSCAGSSRRLGTFAGRGSPPPAGLAGLPPGGGGAPGYPVRRGDLRGFPVRGLAQTAAERGGRPDGPDASARRHVRPARHRRALAGIFARMPGRGARRGSQSGRRARPS
ncbi:hypothetical protein G6F22_019085 [Rhizopus arrhizus]|nr:hypothetical protein G6F22_019085 [Rhizopus arrhizus]